MSKFKTNMKTLAIIFSLTVIVEKVEFLRELTFFFNFFPPCLVGLTQGNCESIECACMID